MATFERGSVGFLLIPNGKMEPRIDANDEEYIRVYSRFLGLFPQTALEDFVDLLARPGENTGDDSFSPDHLVFKNHPIRAHPQAVETF